MLYSKKQKKSLNEIFCTSKKMLPPFAMASWLPLNIRHWAAHQSICDIFNWHYTIDTFWKINPHFCRRTLVQPCTPTHRTTLKTYAGNVWFNTPIGFLCGPFVLEKYAALRKQKRIRKQFGFRVVYSHNTRERFDPSKVCNSRILPFETDIVFIARVLACRTRPIKTARFPWHFKQPCRLP